MKLILASVLFTVSAWSQVVFTPDQPSQAPIPGKIVATAPNLSCTFTGDSVPATSILVACSIGTVSVAPYTIPIASGVSYMVNFTYGPAGTGSYLGGIFTGPSTASTGGSSSSGGISFQVSAGTGSPSGTATTGVL